MKRGTKSVLFGYHSFWLHPFFVLAALRKNKIKLSVYWILAAFFHDLGYWGSPNMDGEEGVEHPIKSSRMLWQFFERCKIFAVAEVFGKLGFVVRFLMHLEDEIIYHSRTIAKRYQRQMSTLGYADKLAFTFYPRWLLRVLYFFSGEFEEYKQIYMDTHTVICCAPIFTQWFVWATRENLIALEGYEECRFPDKRE
jgi:hypothetical protein